MTTNRIIKILLKVKREKITKECLRLIVELKISHFNPRTIYKIFPLSTETKNNIYQIYKKKITVPTLSTYIKLKRYTY